jgi:hypothetical protein
MKKILFTILLLICKVIPTNAQLLSGSAEYVAKKMAFKKALKNVEEKENRYFYKSGSESHYIFNTNNGEIDEDNAAYTDLTFTDDPDTVIVKTWYYSVSKKEYEFIEKEQTSDVEKIAYAKYKHIGGDIYVQCNAMIDGFAPNDICGYFFYNIEKGMYFQRQKVEGGGAAIHMKGKADKHDKELYKDASTEWIKQDQMVYAQGETYNEKIKKARFDAIEKTVDEGIISEFQKINIGKIVFGNVVSEATKHDVKMYKKAFTHDEPIQATFFTNKGLNKFFSLDDRGNPKENLTENNESFFELLVIINGEILTKHTVMIQHTKTLKTSGTFTIVGPKGGTISNNWFKNQLDEYTKNKTQLVTFEIRGGENILIASGSYTYNQKPGANIPYGEKCEIGKDVNSSALKFKTDILKIAKEEMAMSSKFKELTISEMILASDWYTDYGFENIKVLFIMRNKFGICTVMEDEFTVNAERKSITAGFFSNIIVGNIENTAKYSCDCGK